MIVSQGEYVNSYMCFHRCSFCFPWKMGGNCTHFALSIPLEQIGVGQTFSDLDTPQGLGAYDG